jgi:hypothetical protein
MARSFPLEEGGSATGDLITDKSHVPGGDVESVRPRTGNSESFMSATARNFRGMAQVTAVQQRMGMIEPRLPKGFEPNGE